VVDAVFTTDEEGAAAASGLVGVLVRVISTLIAAFVESIDPW